MFGLLGAMCFVCVLYGYSYSCVFLVLFMFD